MTDVAHAWATRDGWRVCSRCGVVRSAKGNKPCAGTLPAVATRGGKRPGAGAPRKASAEQVTRRYMANLDAATERLLLRLMSERRASASKVLAAGIRALAGGPGGDLE